MAISRIDFKTLKARIQFQTILDHYRIALKGYGDQRQGFCPLPTHPRQAGRKPRSPSFSANLSKGVWQCFGCGAKGNHLDFFCRMEGLDPSDRQAFRKATELLVETFLADPGRVEEQRAVRPTAPPKEERRVRINVPLGFELRSLDRSHPYLTERGFTKETIERFGLGYTAHGIMKGRIAIPLHNEQGALIGYAGRIVDDNAIDEDHPKYLFPASRNRGNERWEFRKSTLLYNAHRLMKSAPLGELILVEGYTSVWWLHQAGITNVAATMGATLSTEQFKILELLLAEKARVWLFPDNDAAGKRFAEAASARLASRYDVRLIKLRKEKQPTELSPSALQELLRAN
jgi:DNA primase